MCTGIDDGLSWGNSTTLCVCSDLLSVGDVLVLNGMKCKITQIMDSMTVELVNYTKAIGKLNKAVSNFHEQIFRTEEPLTQAEHWANSWNKKIKRRLK